MRENERELTRKNGWEKFDERWIERKWKEKFDEKEWKRVLKVD